MTPFANLLSLRLTNTEKNMNDLLNALGKDLTSMSIAELNALETAQFMTVARLQTEAKQALRSHETQRKALVAIDQELIRRKIR